MEYDQAVEEIKRRAAERRKENPEIEAELARLSQLPRQLKSEDDYRAALEGNLREANLNWSPGQLPPNTRFRWFKQLLLRLMRVYTAEQVMYNAAVVRTLNAINDGLGHLTRQIEALRTDQAEIVRFVRTVSRIERQTSGLVPEFSRTDLNQSFAEIRGGANFPNRLAFAAQFRGSEAEIKARQRIYVDVFRHHDPVVDLGCGRGEFLELLKEANITAHGIEDDSILVDYVASKGLSVEKANIFEYLPRVKDESVGGFLCSQVIEHLNWEALASLLSLMYSKLAIGGVLVLESPNPSCFNIYAESLYLDPTHVRPYHPLGIKFLCENLGFVDSRIEYQSPVPETNRLPFYSHFQDYAIIARK